MNSDDGKSLDYNQKETQKTWFILTCLNVAFFCVLSIFLLILLAPFVLHLMRD